MVSMLKTKAWTTFTWVFISLTVANIVAHNAFTEPNIFTAQNYIFHVITKPLIMISALYFLTKYLSHKEYQNWILVAFIYSLLGDVLIMGQGINDLFFIGGMAAFFVVQASYIIYFHRSAGAWFGRSTAIQVLQAVMLLYAIGFYVLIFPNLGTFWIPVLLYQTIIGIMVVVALGRFGRVNFDAFAYTLIGAFGLLLANSIFAYNKFIGDITFASFLITLSYCFAQYMILKGFVTLRAPQPSRA